MDTERNSQSPGLDATGQDQNQVIPVVISTHQRTNLFKKYLVYISVFLFGLLGYTIFQVLGKQSENKEIGKNLVLEQGQSVPVNWKSQQFDGLDYKLPPDWGDLVIHESEFGLAGRVVKNDESMHISFLSGINKGYSNEELSKFIDEMAQFGTEGKKMTVGGSEAASGTVDYQGVKNRTVFITTPGGGSQYSIAFSAPTVQWNIETDVFIDQVLSTATFVH